jgi:small subunit ribosomal protein S16
MVKIRLRRTGAKKQPSYRVVVTDSRTPRDGRFIEIIGYYIPTTQPTTVKVQEDRVLYWLSVGAQPTDPVRKILKNLGTLDKFARLKEGADLEQLLAEATASRESGAAQAQKPEKEAAATEPPEVMAATEETASEDS